MHFTIVSSDNINTSPAVGAKDQWLTDFVAGHPDCDIITVGGRQVCVDRSILCLGALFAHAVVHGRYNIETRKNVAGRKLIAARRLHRHFWLYGTTELYNPELESIAKSIDLSCCPPVPTRAIVGMVKFAESDYDSACRSVPSGVVVQRNCTQYLIVTEYYKLRKPIHLPEGVFQFRIQNWIPWPCLGGVRRGRKYRDQAISLLPWCVVYYRWQ